MEMRDESMMLITSPRNEKFAYWISQLQLHTAHNESREVYIVAKILLSENLYKPQNNNIFIQCNAMVDC